MKLPWCPNKKPPKQTPDISQFLWKNSWTIDELYQKIVVPIDLAKTFATTDFYSLVCHFTFFPFVIFCQKKIKSNNIFTLLYILLCHKTKTKNKPGVNKRFCLQKCKLYIHLKTKFLIISCQFFENSSSCPKLLLFWKIWKICATLKQQPLKIEFPAFPLFFGLCLSCFTLKYYHFFAHHSVFLVGKIAGKRWHRKEIKKFSLLFPHILCQLCEWWCWMDAMKNKIKKVFLTHITAHSTLWLSLISSSSF